MSLRRLGAGSIVLTAALLSPVGWLSATAHAAAAEVTITLATSPADGTDIGLAIDTANGTVQATLDDDGGTDATHGTSITVASEDPTVQVTMSLPAGWSLTGVSCSGSSQTTVESAEFTLTSTGASTCTVRLVGPTTTTSTSAPNVPSTSAPSSPSASSAPPVDFASGAPAGFGSLAPASSTVALASALGPQPAVGAAPVAVAITAAPRLTG